jgi:hypothetical protein
MEATISNSNISTKTEMMQKINAAWAELESFLAGLTDQQMTGLYDNQGWNVRDHITHQATWEESIAMLFQGKSRPQILGIEPSQLAKKDFDAINATIRDRKKNMSGEAAVAELRRVHNLLMKSIQTLSDTDLNKPAAVFFPQIPASDVRTVLQLIQADTDGHFLEHLPWMKAIATSAK